MRIGALICLVLLILNGSYFLDNRTKIEQHNKKLDEISLMKIKYEAVGCLEPDSDIKKDTCLILKYKIELKELEVLVDEHKKLVSQIEDKLQNLEETKLALNPYKKKEYIAKR